MGFNCGIVGLPNVGKSTLFNTLTRAGIAAANYPFCTIDPNVGVVAVPDPRLDQLAEIARPQDIVPTVMEFVDIAGLVAGAAQGEGLGNQFLANIRETDAIAHVVRCFEDDDVTHVEGRVDPSADIAVIETELALADLEVVERALDRSQRRLRTGDRSLADRVAVLERVRDGLSGEGHLRDVDLDEAARRELRDLNLICLKPVLYVANVDEASAAQSGAAAQPHVAEVQRIAEERGAVVVPLCAALEAEIAELDEDDRVAFLADLGIDTPGLNRMIHAGYELLGLLTYFTAGPKEVRAWTVVAGATAPQAAGRIHTDFERGFIRAEVIAFADYLACGGETGAREAGRLRSEGRDYVMREGDVVHFRFNV